MSGLRDAVQIGSEPAAAVAAIAAPAVQAKPAALLKAWRCLSVALFAGAIAAPLAAGVQAGSAAQSQAISGLQLHSAGGGGADSPYYMGVGAGLSRLDPAGEFNGFSAAETDSEGFKAFFGKHFKPRWRWELGYTDAGAVGMASPAASASDKPEVAYKVPSLAIDYLLRAPNNKLNFYLRGGAALLQPKSDDSRIQYEDETELTGLVGAGAQWNITDRLLARFGVEAYGADIGFASLSLAARLGRKEVRNTLAPAPAESLPSEAYAAQEPLPRAGAESITSEKTADLEPIRLEKQQSLCRSVDRELRGVSFDPGSAALTVRSRHQLEKVAGALRRGPNIRVTVRGYTDTSGNSKKNLQLSQQRAQAVANYLMLSVGNFNNSPTAVGMGELNPIASNDTAVGRARNRRIELNLQVGDGCAEVAAPALEVDDKARLAAETIVRPLASKAVPTAALSRAPAEHLRAGVKAQLKSVASVCSAVGRVVKGLRFAVSEYRLDTAGRRALIPLLAALRNDTGLRVQIKGHTDASGRADSNQILSARRANSVATYLLNQAPDTVNAPAVIGVGEARPVASNATAEGRARNRRIEVATSTGRDCTLPTQPVNKAMAPATAALRAIASDTLPAGGFRGGFHSTVLPDKSVTIASERAADAGVMVVLAVETELKEPAPSGSGERTVANAVVAAEAGAVVSGMDDGSGMESQPAVQALVDVDVTEQASTDAAVSVLPEPVAEPTLSDTLGSASGEQAVGASAACTGIDRIVSGVAFERGSTRLSGQSRRALEPVVRLLRRDPLITVSVEGHTDNRGGARQNMMLSERRAKVVAAYLAGGAGLVKNPPSALGYGETKPLFDNATAHGRERNRRIAIKLHGGRGCLSNEMLAGISELEDVRAVQSSVPRTQALSVQPAAAAARSFADAMRRVARGHGACGKVAHVVDGVGFNPGDHRLEVSDQRALMPLVAVWRENPVLRIEVRGHTDNVGSAAGNLRLSQRRAESVAMFLMFESGLVEDTPAARGMGESSPRAANDSKTGRQMNRRIEVVLSGGHRCDTAQAGVIDQGRAATRSIPVLAVVDPQLPAAVAGAPSAQMQSISGGGSAAVMGAPMFCGEPELIHSKVKFDTGAFFLDDHSRVALAPVVDRLMRSPALRVEVQGHTDNVGVKRRNLALSERRADAVAQYLLHATGNALNAPVAVGYGAEKPLGDNSSAAGRAENRRIDILLSADPRCEQGLASQSAHAEISEQPVNLWALPSRQLAMAGGAVLSTAEQCVAVQRVVDGLSFAPAGFRLDVRAKNALAPVLDILRNDAGLLVDVYGYSADHGDPDFDLGLAERRAEAVADYLMVETGNFENLPVPQGFAGREAGAGLLSAGEKFRANRIELRISQGSDCERPAAGDTTIQRSARQLSLPSEQDGMLMLSHGGGSAPDAVVAAQSLSCDSQYRVVDGVSFRAGSAVLDRPSRKALDTLAWALMDQPALRLEVHGHTDARGEESENLDLSQSRAHSVARYLFAAVGQWSAAPEATGYGETRPLASNDTPSGRATNRRIELKIDDSRCA